jgi:hypothetical protein
LAVVLVAAAVYATAPGAASARSSPAASTPADRAAVHPYLLDLYAYAQTITKAAPVLVGAYEGTASRIAGECPGALVGAPQENQIEVGPSIPQRTARQRGQEKRQSTQLIDLEEELASELASAERESRRPAAIVLLAELKALPPGGPALSRVVRAQTIGLEEDLKVENTDVCADMEAWVGSGYRTLSQDSRAIALKRETELARFLTDLGARSASESIPPVETSADKALVLETSQLEKRTGETIVKSIDSARKRVEAALGLTARAKREERLKSISHESKSSTEIGAGRTAAGTSYTVSLERTKGGGPGCKARVQIRPPESAASGAFGKILEILGSESLLCLSGGAATVPQVQCSEGLIEIRARLLSATRTVILHLSDGRRIASRPVRVPARLGGPAAIYYQAVRGPSPFPVSLTERDARGHTLRVLKLRRIVGCSKHPLKYLPGGKRTLVRGSTPQGPSFSIVGERYRLFGRVHTQLKLRTGEGLVSSDEADEGEENVTEGQNGSFEVPVKRTTPLDFEVSASCHPHEYSIFYGMLEQPRDTVLAKVAGKLVPALRVHIPSSLHTGGALVYLASVSQPEEILVRSPSGKTIMNEDRSRTAIEGRETCEGESEGPGPPPGGLDGAGETSRIVLSG